MVVSVHVGARDQTWLEKQEVPLTTKAVSAASFNIFFSLNFTSYVYVNGTLLHLLTIWCTVLTNKYLREKEFNKEAGIVTGIIRHISKKK